MEVYLCADESVNVSQTNNKLYRAVQSSVDLWNILLVRPLFMV